FSCSNCKFVFNFEEPLKRHLKLCYQYPSGISPHVCKLCGEIFSTSKLLNDHEEQAHNKKTQFECKYCKAPFSSSRNLIIHERVHEKEPVSCGICKAQFTYFAPLKVH
ncbi:hypothetical protein HELRODRAFT_142477, partial [Helobdella robusta]|uniref:C2H2-type domain-containing protein n=1 Tax=Helobdella robusta TaxID=6412 RepID=T1EJ58_HELRO